MLGIPWISGQRRHQPQQRHLRSRRHSGKKYCLLIDLLTVLSFSANLLKFSLQIKIRILVFKRICH
jgi:hypothetical protein